MLITAKDIKEFIYDIKEIMKIENRWEKGFNILVVCSVMILPLFIIFLGYSFISSNISPSLIINSFGYIMVTLGIVTNACGFGYLFSKQKKTPLFPKQRKNLLLGLIIQLPILFLLLFTLPYITAALFSFTEMLLKNL
ncbi:hypothetical protein JR536_002941 [Listeria monocytogenes]|uniref:hypothetical protein n=1 Tax=Listeria monocytogenes TaxID=1639 RepID=UPI00083D7CD1|nr:hypothetical protein [Listeria monocytogenes]EAE3700715.1 hypothetical protein [Listeria monocytogenes]EAE8240948.1 hypothetical protein [Listeria monocytogenes]EAF6025766.1 hypothetical protein [Listeria monocytogenes]EAG0099855.1 hypothetical protein [Listeria monocytogenes]EAG0495858.1 hypothetical protein [Listeria monocytogenes]